MTKRKRSTAYLDSPEIRRSIAAVAIAVRRAEEVLTEAGTHRLTDVERADLADAIARLTRLAATGGTP